MPGCVAAALCCLAAPGAAHAQADTWGSPVSPDRPRFSSQGLEASDATVPPAGQWERTASAGCFNLCQTAWHTGAIHRELHTLEQRFPDDQFDLIDLAGWREDIRVPAGLGGGYAVTVRVPWIEIGSPHWDAIAEVPDSSFHFLVGRPL